MSDFIKRLTFSLLIQSELIQSEKLWVSLLWSLSSICRVLLAAPLPPKPLRRYVKDIRKIGV
jgi:hypothetical protein